MSERRGGGLVFSFCVVVGKSRPMAKTIFPIKKYHNLCSGLFLQFITHTVEGIKHKFDFLPEGNYWTSMEFIEHEKSLKSVKIDESQ